MKASNAKDYLPLVQALIEGKSIQYNTSADDENPNWVDCEELISDESAKKYRIKPKPLDVWINHYTFEDPTVHYCKDSALKSSAKSHVTITRHYREVIE